MFWLKGLYLGEDVQWRVAGGGESGGDSGHLRDLRIEWTSNFL